MSIVSFLKSHCESEKDRILGILEQWSGILQKKKSRDRAIYPVTAFKLNPRRRQMSGQVDGFGFVFSPPLLVLGEFVSYFFLI